MKKNINEKMEANTKKMEANMKEQMKEMRGEMRRVGQCLQAGKRATPSAVTTELRGSAPAGEDRAIRETCWARREKVTETVTRTLRGEETTSTRETRREVTEWTETREMGTVEERLHGVEVKDGVGDAHTHTRTQLVRDNGGELAERVGTRGEQLVVLPREQGEGVCPLEATFHDALPCAP